MGGFAPFGGGPFGADPSPVDGDVLESLVLAQNVDAAAVQRLFDGMALASPSPDTELAMTLHGLLTLQQNNAGLAAMRANVSSAMALSASPLRVHLSTVVGSMALAQSLNSSFVVALIDSMRLLGVSAGTMHALAHLVDAVVMAEAPRLIQLGNVTSAAQLSHTLFDRVSYIESLLTSLAFSDAAVGKALVTMVVEDSFVLDETLTPLRHLIGAINSGIDFSIGFDLGDVAYVAYSMNAATKGLTSYTNFNFTSLANFNGTVYASGPAGLYALGGTTDAGTEIVWRIRTGLTNFNTGKQKGMDAAYLGYTASGRVALKCIVVAPSGEKKAYWYELTSPTAGASAPGRIMIGRGLKSVYWGFELSNITAGDIELDIIELHPVVFEGRLP